MNRWTLLGGGAITLVGLGVVALSGFDTLFATETRDATKRVLAQLASPPGSNVDKKATTTQAPAQAPAATAAQAPAAPAAAPKPSAQAPGWAVNCKSEAKEKDLSCRMSQTVVLKTGQVLTNVTFRVPAETKKPVVVVQLPLGVSLAAGASLQVDDNAAQRLSYKACDRNGCYAELAIAPEVLATLRRGKQLKVSFQTLADKPINIPLSLEGFTDAYDKIQKSS